MFRRSPKIVTKLTNSAMKQTNKMVIYQVFPRWFGNMKSSLVKNGSKVENGIGKFSDFTPGGFVQDQGVGNYPCVVYRSDRTCNEYRLYGLPDTKRPCGGREGKCRLPYAIKDYYDIDPDLADNVPDRMKEFESLVRGRMKLE